MPNESVRVMLARNPHLTFEERQVLWRDENVYVRRDLAGNLRINDGEMRMIIQTQPDIVLSGLAGNPAAPQKTLLEVFQKLQKRGADNCYYSRFAWNPNCPQEIIDLIANESSGKTPFDESDRKFLQLTMDFKQQCMMLSAHGKPFPSFGCIWGEADLWWPCEKDIQNIEQEHQGQTGE